MNTQEQDAMNETQVPRITGLLLIEVRNSNPNGDPDRESSPRQRSDGRGEISPVSVKRKERDLVEEKEGEVWQALQSSLALEADRYQILESRGRNRNSIKEMMSDDDGNLTDNFKNAYWDGRLFGNTFLEEGGGDTIRAGVAHFGLGLSVAPLDVLMHTWTNKAGVEGDKDRGMAPLTFRVVKHGLYTMPFFVNPSQARKTGCDGKDVELMLELLKHAYPHTRSVIRTQVEVVHAHVLTHNNPLGSFSDFALLDALAPIRNGDPEQPSKSLADYTIPVWDDIKDSPIRNGSAKKWEDVGRYKDYAM